MKESAGPNASAVVGNIDKCPWHEPVWSVQPLSSAFWPVALRISERNQSDRSNGRWIVCKKKNRRERGNACWACCCRIHDFTHLWFGLSDYRKLVRGEDIRCDNFFKTLDEKERNWTELTSWPHHRRRCSSTNKSSIVAGWPSSRTVRNDYRTLAL